MEKTISVVSVTNEGMSCPIGVLGRIEHRPSSGQFGINEFLPLLIRIRTPAGAERGIGIAEIRVERIGAFHGVGARTGCVITHLHGMAAIKHQVGHSKIGRAFRIIGLVVAELHPAPVKDDGIELRIIGISRNRVRLFLGPLVVIHDLSQGGGHTSRDS